MCDSDIEQYIRLKEELKLKHDKMVVISDALHVLKTRGNEEQKKTVDLLSESFRDNGDVKKDVEVLKELKTKLMNYRYDLYKSLANMFRTYEKLHQATREDLEYLQVPEPDMILDHQIVCTM